MMRDNYIDINKLIKSKNVLKLFNIVDEHGGALRFVGGAVRDTLAGLEGFDLDLATDLSPDELVEACEDNGLKTIPLGIKYGTVGVMIDDKVLEVTSLRKDIKTDGRHAEVEFTTDWETDAGRRDLTINAVYADERGNVFDYYNGIDDLEKGIVRFIGNPSQRIKEDYLRILRFFRFYSIFAKTPIDKKALEACKENSEGLQELSMERIRDELCKILVTPKAAETVKIMADNEILSYILPVPKDENIECLEFLDKQLNQGNLPKNAIARLFILFNPDEAFANNIAVRMKFSKKQKQDFVDLARVVVPLRDFEDERCLKRIIYTYGKDFARDKLMITQALQKQILPDFKEILNFILAFEKPTFPLRGQDIINAGIQGSPHIGQVLSNLEDMWIESGFSLSKQELLERLQGLKIA